MSIYKLQAETSDGYLFTIFTDDLDKNAAEDCEFISVDWVGIDSAGDSWDAGDAQWDSVQEYLEFVGTETASGLITSYKRSIVQDTDDWGQTRRTLHPSLRQIWAEKYPWRAYYDMPPGGGSDV